MKRNRWLLPFLISCTQNLPGNYLEVRFLKEGKVKSILLRTTLTRAEEQMTSHSSIMRCNRAFLVKLRTQLFRSKEMRRVCGSN